MQPYSIELPLTSHFASQGICFTNVFAENPCPFMRFYNDYETALYEALEAGK